MLSLNRGPWACGVVLVAVAILPRIGNRVFAAEPHPAGDIGQCQTVVRNFQARAPLVRRSNARIARLLDARRYRQAVPALRSAASAYADAWAGDTLGNLYAAGLGVPHSAGSAFRWYLWSAERGDRFAQREVANAYLNGVGTKPNVAAAAYWFRIGIAPWQLAVMYYSLSQTYAQGHLAPVNPSKAAYYLGKSVAELRTLAREPSGEAAYYLGLDYEYGHGVPRNPTKAVGYFCRAAALQYAPAVTAIRHLPEQSP